MPGPVTGASEGSRGAAAPGASWHGEGLEAGLARVDALGAEGQLESYYLYHAARADLLRRMNRPGEAAGAYASALRLVTNPAEKRFIERRLAGLYATG